jgi:hypothetical protein
MGSPRETSADTEAITDPVCGMVVDPSSDAFSHEYKGDHIISAVPIA